MIEVLDAAISQWSLRITLLRLILPYLKWPLLAIDASGFRVPFRAASCCSKALDSKYSSQAAASCQIYHKTIDYEKSYYSLYHFEEKEKPVLLITQSTIIYNHNDVANHLNTVLQDPVNLYSTNYNYKVVF